MLVSIIISGVFVFIIIYIILFTKLFLYLFSCFVCDKLASECDSWDTTSGGHCNAHDKDEKYVQLREVTLNARGTTSKPSALDGEVTLLNSQPPRNPYQQQQRGSGGGGGGMMQQMTSLINNEFLTRLGTGNDTSDAATARASVKESRRQNTKQKKDMRITGTSFELSDCLCKPHVLTEFHPLFLSS